MGKIIQVARGCEPVEELMGDLSDALEILYVCRSLGVPVTDPFLDYIDTLIDGIEVQRPYTLPDQSSNPTNTGSGFNPMSN